MGFLVSYNPGVNIRSLADKESDIIANIYASVKESLLIKTYNIFFEGNIP